MISGEGSTRLHTSIEFFWLVIQRNPSLDGLLCIDVWPPDCARQTGWRTSVWSRRNEAASFSKILLKDTGWKQPWCVRMTRYILDLSQESTAQSTEFKTSGTNTRPQRNRVFWLYTQITCSTRLIESGCFGRSGNYGCSELFFVFNYYRHWSSLILLNRNGTASILHSREGVMQGNPLAMIAYGIVILWII